MSDYLCERASAYAMVRPFPLLEPGDIFSCDSNPYQLPATRDHAVALDFETSMAIDRIPPDFEQGASHGSR
jgi:hypothetical protein